MSDQMDFISFNKSRSSPGLAALAPVTHYNWTNSRRSTHCPRPSARWHLDEMVVRMGGKRMYLWRAVDDEGEVLDVLVQRRRDKAAARKLMRRLLKKHGFAPVVVVTDKLRSYSSAFRDRGLSVRHEQGLRQNNRAENSHLPVRRRERKL